MVLDDLITTGGSKIEAIAPLAEAGLVVKDVVVLVDREQGGAEELAARGLRLHAALTLGRSWTPGPPRQDRRRGAACVRSALGIA